MVIRRKGKEYITKGKPSRGKEGSESNVEVRDKKGDGKITRG
jgi:hypothetical protein